MDTIDERRAVIQPLNKFWYQNKVAALDLLRLDLLHPVVSGNKWYKLRLNLMHAMERGYKTVVTSGGGYSNHLIATAYTAKQYGLKSVGIVRGKYDPLTPTLMACEAEGMELIYITQEDYGNRHQPEWAENIVAHFDDVMIIPEGGANEWGRAGAGLLDRFIKDDYTHVLLSVGTGTTLIGIRNKVSTSREILGFVPMKKGRYLEETIRTHLTPEQDKNWRLFDEWHFGGFGKWTSELIGFMNDFYRENKMPLDIVYTSKMMYGVRQMLDNQYFSSKDKLLCVHTGGIQGNSSVQGDLIF